MRGEGRGGYNMVRKPYMDLYTSDIYIYIYNIYILMNYKAI